jgi:hypothetical protein
MVAALGVLSACGGGDSNGPGGGNGGDGGAAGRGGSAGSGGAIDPALLEQAEISFVENLHVKVAVGHWSFEEGLIASLEAMAGERDATSILLRPDLLNAEGTGILKLANEYLDDGSEADTKTEIARLLGVIVFSRDRLEAMASPDPPTPAPVSADPIVRKGSVEDCTLFFAGHGDIPPGIGNCLEVRSSTLLDELYPGFYHVFGPAPPFPKAGWTDQHFDLALEAMEQTVPIYAELAEMPPIYVVLSAAGSTKYLAQAAPSVAHPCGVVLYTSMQSISDSDFKQTVAHEAAHCFQGYVFAAQNEVYYDSVKWREEGLAEYLSNVVYPANNFEWGSDRRKAIRALERWELTKTVLERVYTNFMFFQYLGNRIGDEGIVGLVKTLPTDAGTGQFQQGLALGAYPGMAGIYHDFAKAMTDQEVIDSSGEPIPYQLGERNRPLAAIRGPLFVMEGFRQFGVSRYLVIVQEGMRGDVTFTPDGDIREASRPETGGDWGPIPTEMPDDGCIREVLMVATSLEDGTGFDFEVPEVEDSDAVCDIHGTWIVNNSSLRFDPGDFDLTFVNGQIKLTFEEEGTLELVYTDFSYQFLRDTLLDIGGQLTKRHEEITYTTNASGVTTFEIDDDQIVFGHFFEGGYLVGQEEVHEVRNYNPSIPSEDIDEVRVRSPDGIGLFGTAAKFELQSSGSTLVILGPNDRTEATLYRTSSEPD